MSFLGRKLYGKFEGEIVVPSLDPRLPSHGWILNQTSFKENWLKMYDKSGLVLRVETLNQQPRGIPGT